MYTKRQQQLYRGIEAVDDGTAWKLLAEADIA